jgi:hypothetical protein
MKVTYEPVSLGILENVDINEIKSHMHAIMYVTGLQSTIDKIYTKAVTTIVIPIQFNSIQLNLLTLYLSLQ